MEGFNLLARLFGQGAQGTGGAAPTPTQIQQQQGQVSGFLSQVAMGAAATLVSPVLQSIQNTLGNVATAADQNIFGPGGSSNMNNFFQGQAEKLEATLQASGDGTGSMAQAAGALAEGMKKLTGVIAESHAKSAAFDFTMSLARDAGMAGQQMTPDQINAVFGTMRDAFQRGEEAKNAAGRTLGSQ